MRLNYKIAALALAAGSLAACGGGGDDTPPAPPAPQTTAEGAWTGNLSDGNNYSALVLENGAFYAYYGPRVNGVSYVYGVTIGSGESNNGTYRVANARTYSVFSATPTTTTIDATYVVNTSIQGSIAEGVNKLTFSGIPAATSTFNYNTPASAATVEGAWMLSSGSGDTIAVNVTNGALRASSGWCTFTGTIKPRASGKNVFDVSLKAGNESTCALANQTATGIAIASAQAGGTQMMLLGTTADRSTAIVAVGTR